MDMVWCLMDRDRLVHRHSADTSWTYRQNRCSIVVCKVRAKNDVQIVKLFDVSDKHGANSDPDETLFDPTLV